MIYPKKSLSHVAGKSSRQDLIYQPHSARSVPQEATEDRSIPIAVRNLDESLGWNPSPNRIYRCSHKAPDPHLAAKVLNTLSGIYSRNICVHRPVILDLTSSKPGTKRFGIAEQQLNSFHKRRASHRPRKMPPYVPQ
jgi:hypothetical protein